MARDLMRVRVEMAPKRVVWRVDGSEMPQMWRGTSDAASARWIPLRRDGVRWCDAAEDLVVD